ncbi:gamma-glutamyl-gamma-aminobutyrate hydrolase family protein [Vannielia litorea]|uniref:gamma-glutamyl-gamma-aminobutyrate hydrolase family protein n=1 Tax=Vannielia litorea TaxID=1217970 RepID=UPI001BCD940F|nr:gamma-glutamyl-gamma-aminobutyrate hydrolase family protein [Vannielia litorea]MBS8228948.1 hypothetical protein [Vannielia litorea]
MPGPINIGVTWRRDGRNVAHRGDLAVFDHIDLRGDLAVFSLAWDGADTPDDLNLGELGDMHLLVVPGGPHANDTQIPTVKMNRGRAVALNPANAPRPGGTATYARERAQSELDLIEQARMLGMPILALCGGSWRLVENYGGSTIELAALDRDGKVMTSGFTKSNRTRHAGAMDNVSSEFKHGIHTRPGSLLEDATGRAGVRKGLEEGETMPEMHVNSVHWSAVRTGNMGTRPGMAPQPFDVTPNNMLQKSAVDSGKPGTSEAVESAAGAPVIGAQWHPEYQLPTHEEDEEHPTSRANNLALIQYMIDAAKAYQSHRASVEALIERFGRGAPIGRAEGVRFSGAPAHTGATPGAPMPASSIPRHASDRASHHNMAGAEKAVRAYLFGLGRDRNLFLTPYELLNLALGAPLSTFRTKKDRSGKRISSFMFKNVWARKYCSQDDKDMILKTWPA